VNSRLLSYTIANSLSMSEHLPGAHFNKSETKGLYEPHGSVALGESTERSSKHNREVAAAVPQFQQWRQVANQVKRYVIRNLDKLLAEFERNVKARGGEVLWAADADEANRHVMRIARENGVTSVVKGKSMVSEEMELNHHFEAAGIRAVETDLGEYIVQLAGQRPTHIVTPALHMSAEEVGRLFSEKLAEPYSAEHQHLTNVARRHLREEYLRAEMGITGVNFALADTGDVCVIENEGNSGLSCSTPPVHVALMGIEKILPGVDYLPLFLNLLGRSGTGQKLTTYTHIYGKASPGKKFYVIIVDNGRTEVLRDPAAWMSLFCIRCGACLNACPVYRRTGGWAYGWVYPGPIGAILVPHLVGLDKAASLPFASSLCGACGEVCPVMIDIPHQLVHLRHRATSESTPMNSFTERLMWKAWAWAMVRPWRYKLAMGVVKLGVRMAKFLPWHPGKLGQWTRGRELPRPPAEPAFRGWWRRHGKQYEQSEE